MAITEERKAEHRARVAALRERFGDPNEALDNALREMFPKGLAMAAECGCEIDESKEAQKEAMLTFFRENATGGDRENVHAIVDELLLTYINDIEITEAFRKMGLWYA